MVDTLTIKKVKTGEGLAGTRTALLFAPKNAKAGSLTALTDFINTHKRLRAVPGYYGRRPVHVLRISGLRDDAELRSLLETDFAQWQAKHREPDVTAINIDKNLHYGPVHVQDEYADYSPIKGFIKERANSLAALSYLIGNTALLFSAQHGKRHGKAETTDWFKAYSSVAYNSASVVLAVLGHEAEKPQDVHAMVHKLYPKLKDADVSTQQDVKNTTEHTLSFLKRHPWEIAAAINASGAIAHIASAAKRRKTQGKKAEFEVLAALGGLTAMSIIGFVPEKNSLHGPDAHSVFDRKSCDSLLSSTEALQQSEGCEGQTVSSLARFKDWLMQNPLALAGGVSAISSSSYGFAALRSKPKDIGLLVTSGAYLTGNLIQTQARKVHAASFDDVVSSAADIIRSDPLLAGEPAEKTEQRIAKLSEALSYESSVVFTKDQINRGIHARLKTIKPPNYPSDKGAERFIDQEVHVLKQSPFASHQFVYGVCHPQAGQGATL